MILGLLTIVALFVIRMGFGASVPLPDEITLPAGAKAIAFTQGIDWYGVVTSDDMILIFDRASGALLQSISVKTAP